MVRGFLARNVWVIVLTAILVTAISGVALVELGHQRQLAAQQALAEDLRHQLGSAQASVAAQQDTALQQSLGVSQARISKDTTLITGLLNTAMTWDSGAAYDKNRQALIHDYRLSENDQFLAAVMPAQAYRVDASGKSYYYIDALGVTSHLSSQKVALASATATDYHYVAIATLDVANSAVSGSSTSRDVLIHVTVTGDGKIKDLSGAVSQGAAARSN